MNLASVVTINPQLHSGDPVFKGTRIPVTRLFDYLETGSTVEGFISECEFGDPQVVWDFLALLKATFDSPSS